VHETIPPQNCDIGEGQRRQTPPGLTQIIMPDTVGTIGISAFRNAGGEELPIRLSQNLRAIRRRAAVALYYTDAAVAGLSQRRELSHKRAV
jgi:hypothetical protein